MADAHANTIRLIRAVNKVSGQVELQYVGAERIVRTRRHDRWQRVATLLMFLLNGPGHIPVGITRFRNHSRFTERRFPADAADADRIRQDLDWFALADCRVVKQALRRDIQNDAAPGRVRQHVLRRQ